MDSGERKQKQQAGSYRDLWTLGRVLEKLIVYTPADMLLLIVHILKKGRSVGRSFFPQSGVGVGLWLVRQ